MLYLGVLILLIFHFLRPQEVPILRDLRLVFITMLILTPAWLVTLQRKKILRTQQDLFMGLLYLAAIFSYWNFYKSRTYVPVLEFGRDVILYLFVAHAIDSSRRVAMSLVVIMGMLAIVAATAGRVEFGPTAGQFAGIGMFNNRNDLAYAIAIAFPIALVFIFRGNIFSKLIGLAALAFGAPALYMTDSRGGMLAAIGSVYALLFINAKRAATKIIMACFAFCVLLAAFALSPRLSTVQDYKSDESAMGRVESWSFGLSAFKEHPIFGGGYHQWKDFSGSPIAAHNSYINVMAELGMFGLFAYIGMLYFSIKTCYRLYHEGADPYIRTSAFALYGVVVGQALAGLFQTRCYHTIVMASVAISSAMLIINSRMIAENESDLEIHRKLELESIHPDDNLWERSQSLGIKTKGLVTKRHAYELAGLCALCWLAHKLFVMTSY